MSAQKTPIATPELVQEEYRSLRATLQHRGTLRFVLALTTWSVWAALALYSWTNGPAPLAGVIPLLVLIGGFEVVLSLHAGVERVGRYIQLMFESGEPTPPAWEHTAMVMGRNWLSPGGLDPLFSYVFLGAAMVNSMSAVAGGTTTEIVVAIATHLLFAVRIIAAQQFVGKQRAHDLGSLTKVISSNSLVSKIQQGR